MLKSILSYAPISQQEGISVIRIIVGFFMVYHGWEIFDADTIEGYTERDAFKNYSSPLFMVYLGQTFELVGGLLLAFGFLTRISSVILAATMLYVSFLVGEGKIWYEDQHPFLFVLLAFVFFFTGPGK